MGTNTIDLPHIVVNKDGVRARVLSVIIKAENGGEHNSEFSLSTFLTDWVEYIDPKDIEIARLRKQVADLKEKNRKPRKKYRIPTLGEIAEMQALIRQGETGIKIATEYEVSESYVGRLRTEVKKESADEIK